MPKCGIKKYDNLPGRVGLMDVDYLRFKLIWNRDRQKKLINEEKIILEKLNIAHKKWKEKQKI